MRDAVLNDYGYVRKAWRRELPYVALTVGAQNALTGVAFSTAALLHLVVRAQWPAGLGGLTQVVVLATASVAGLIAVNGLLAVTSRWEYRVFTQPVAGFWFDTDGPCLVPLRTPDEPLTIPSITAYGRNRLRITGLLAVALAVTGMWALSMGTVGGDVVALAVAPAAMWAWMYAVLIAGTLVYPAHRVRERSVQAWRWHRRGATAMALVAVGVGLVLPFFGSDAVISHPAAMVLMWLAAVLVGPLVVHAVAVRVKARSSTLPPLDIGPIVTPAVNAPASATAASLGGIDATWGAVVWDGGHLAGYVPPVAMRMEPDAPLARLARPLLGSTPIPRVYVGDVDPGLLYNAELVTDEVCAVAHGSEVIGYVTVSAIATASLREYATVNPVNSKFFPEEPTPF